MTGRYTSNYSPLVADKLVSDGFGGAIKRCEFVGT
jgi:hypothetical protein